MSREYIFNSIETERAYQDKRWGNAFDDKNTLNDWVTYINHYLADASKMPVPVETQRKNLLKAATLCIAALETLDRNGTFAPRHYD